MFTVKWLIIAQHKACLVLDVPRIQLNIDPPIVNTPKESSPLSYHSTPGVVSHCRKHRTLVESKFRQCQPNCIRLMIFAAPPAPAAATAAPRAPEAAEGTPNAPSTGSTRGSRGDTKGTQHRQHQRQQRGHHRHPADAFSEAERAPTRTTAPGQNPLEFQIPRRFRNVN